MGRQGGGFMLRADGGDAIDLLFRDPTTPPLSVLRQALLVAYPDLFASPGGVTPDAILETARRDAVGRGVRPGPPVVAPAADPDPCLPPSAGVGGWFAAHAFRIARVYHEVARHSRSLEGDPAVPTNCMRQARARLSRWFVRKPDRAADALQAGFERALARAGSFDCRYADFGPWFLRLLGGVAEELGSDAAAYDRMAGLPFDVEPRAKPAPEARPLSDAEWLAEFAREGVEVSPEFFRRAAKLALSRRGAVDPPEELVAREARLFERYYADLVGRPADPDQAELKLYELYVGYGHHRDYARELPATDSARAVLDDVLVWIAELFRQHERSARGEPNDLAATRRTPYTDTVSLLAGMQERTWALLAGRAAADPVWHAADNLRWLSWQFHGAALLALCRRYAVRVGGPALDPLLAALAAGNWLSNIRPADRAVFAAHLSVVCPGGGVIDAPEAGAARLLAVGVCLAGERGRDGKPLPRRLLDDVTSALPDADWGWWVSRVVGRDPAAADAGADRLLDRLAAVRTATR